MDVMHRGGGLQFLAVNLWHRIYSVARAKMLAANAVRMTRVP